MGGRETQVGEHISLGAAELLGDLGEAGLEQRGIVSSSGYSTTSQPAISAGDPGDAKLVDFVVPREL
jgi:hypothetical protein